MDIQGDLWFNKLSKVTFSPFIQVPNTAQSIRTGLGTSLCSLSGLSLPSRPNSLFLLEPFTNKTRNLCLLPAQTVSAKHGPLPGQVVVCRHRTVTPNPDLVNPESFMETSRSAGDLLKELESFNQTTEKALTELVQSKMAKQKRPRKSSHRTELKKHVLTAHITSKNYQPLKKHTQIGLSQNIPREVYNNRTD